MDALSVVLEEMRLLRELIEGLEARRGRPLALTYKRAAVEIGRGVKTISRMVQRGELLSIRGAGRSRLIATAELERWIAERQKSSSRITRRSREKISSVAEEVAKAREMLKRRR